ncbi:PREDICTED: NAC domain-containing protein 105-like isoform X4 [Prunus mume]|uniref:NAC domain-containing protein 105-like isoform X4 n=1 Tax=Prunus mume TaxID=102107 RepID=A0ABM1LXW8_PRUMU|nr:PREDICTED: NAC domain-containing protein 105-like isoform X4 [Prunus mume]
MGSKCNRKTTGGVSVPVGFRFHPTEEELVNHYLRKKKQDKDFKVNHIIPEIAFCKHEPCDLPGLLFTEPDSPYHDMEWFFFSLKDYKYSNSNRSNRATPKGYWKITGKERVIRARGSKFVIGRKRTLTFYEGRVPKSKKTNWVMHEYYLIEDEANSNPKLAKRDFVLCRLKKKLDKKDTSICAEGEPSNCNLSNCEDQVAAVVTPESQDHSPSTLQSPASIELGDVLQANDINEDCNEMQSPFGDNEYHVTDNNDISTCDEGEPHGFTMSDFKNEVADDMSRELYAQQERNLDPTYTELEGFMYIDASGFENQAGETKTWIHAFIHLSHMITAPPHCSHQYTLNWEVSHMPMFITINGSLHMMAMDKLETPLLILKIKLHMKGFQRNILNKKRIWN